MTRAPRRVLVLGATGTIGRAVVRALVSRGDALVPVARDVRRLTALVEQLGAVHPGASVAAVAGDIAGASGPAEVAREARAMGGVDDLVLCAGGFARTPAERLDAAALEAAWRVHAAGPLLLVRELAGELRAARGAVVAVSDLGVGVPFPHHAAYLSAKGALEAGLRALAHELAPEVRVNVVRPGVVTDPGHERDVRRGTSLASRSLLGRLGTPEEVAHVVVAALDATWASGRVWEVG
jgi:pteridine reductase